MSKNILQKDEKVPNFMGIDQNANQISSENYLGKKYIIFFYPKSFTPGCTLEVCNLRDNIEKLKEIGYSIIGISADSQEKQLKFHEKYNLTYPLIADENKEISKIFGTWGEKKMFGKKYEGIHRTTFIINESGIIDEVIEKVKIINHTEQIIKIINKIK